MSPAKMAAIWGANSRNHNKGRVFI